MLTTLSVRTQRGKYLGQIGFMAGCQRETSARSKNISMLAFLHHDDFVKVLKQYPQDYVSFPC